MGEEEQVSEELFPGLTEDVRAEAEKIRSNPRERTRIIRRLALKYLEDAWRPMVEEAVRDIAPGVIGPAVRRMIEREVGEGYRVRAAAQATLMKSVEEATKGLRVRVELGEGGK